MPKAKRPDVYICAPDPIFAVPDRIWSPFVSGLTGDAKHDYQATMNMAARLGLNPLSVRARIRSEQEEALEEVQAGRVLH
jgi:hypothetical protein